MELNNIENYLVNDSTKSNTSGIEGMFNDILTSNPETAESFLGELLEKTGYDLNMADKDGITILHYAAKNNHLDVVKFLLKQEGIDINVEIRGGTKTPFHYAVQSGNLELVRLFLSLPNLNVKAEETVAILGPRGKLLGSRKKTALHYAFESDEINLELIKALLSHPEIGVNVKFKKGETLLNYFIKNGNREMVDILLKRDNVDLNLQDNNKKTPLHIAIEKGDKETIMNLLNNESINLNLQDNDKETPLHVAINQKDVDLVRFLSTNKNLDLNIKGKDGKTYLHYIAELGDEYAEIFEFLVEKIDVNAKDYYGYTIFESALRMNNIRIINSIVNNKNFYINSQISYGRTPLDIAIDCKNNDVIKLLIDNERIDIKTALYSLIKKNCFEMVEYLIEKNPEYIEFQYGVEEKTLLHLAVENKAYEIIKFLVVNTNIDVNKKTVITPLSKDLDKGGYYTKDAIKQGKAPFYIAVENQDIKAMGILESREQLDINTTEGYSSNIKTPLYVAAIEKKDPEMTTILICHPFIDINAKVTHNNRTILHCAVEEGNIEILNILLSRSDIDINAKEGGYYNRTPLDIAIEKKNIDVIKPLLDKKIENIKNKREQILDCKNTIENMKGVCNSFKKEDKIFSKNLASVISQYEKQLKTIEKGTHL